MYFIIVNDPSADSPTETLLRLLLPLNNLVYKCLPLYYHLRGYLFIQFNHQRIQSVGATGGVYKRQGHIQAMLMTSIY